MKELIVKTHMFIYFLGRINLSSMNGSGRFVGVARMASKCDQEMIFEYWAMDEIWKGLMQVEWIFIKDVPNRILKEIKLR